MMNIEQLADEIRAEHRASANRLVSRGTLTDREIQVLRLLCAGQSHKQIALTLDVSPRTIDSHHWHISQKTGCKTGPQLGVWAVRNGVL